LYLCPRLDPLLAINYFSSFVSGHCHTIKVLMLAFSMYDIPEQSSLVLNNLGPVPTHSNTG